LLAVEFLRQAFVKNKSLKEYNQTDFPKAFIPYKLERYIFDNKPLQVNGKSKKNKVLNVDKYEFLVYKLLKNGLEAGEIYSRQPQFQEF
jgi:hypothetical protein